MDSILLFLIVISIALLVHIERERLEVERLILEEIKRRNNKDLDTTVINAGGT